MNLKFENKNLSLAMLFLSLIFIQNNSFGFGLKNTYFNEKKLSGPVREIAIIVTDDGYFPEHPTVFAGETVRIFVTSTSSRPSCLILKGKEVFLEAKRGELSESVVYFDKAAKIDIYCPAGNHKASLSVIEHPSDQKKRIEREIASEASKNLKIWHPRDE